MLVCLSRCLLMAHSQDALCGLSWCVSKVLLHTVGDASGCAERPSEEPGKGNKESTWVRRGSSRVSPCLLVVSPSLDSHLSQCPSFKPRGPAIMLSTRSWLAPFVSGDIKDLIEEFKAPDNGQGPTRRQRGRTVIWYVDL
jgi:hypothetical protein